MPHQINEDKCTSCGTCEPLCPVDAIAKAQSDKYQIDANECVDCQTCERVCPAEATLGGPKSYLELVKS